MTQWSSSTLMQLWNQNSQASERLLKKALLAGLDTIEQQESAVLPLIKMGPTLSQMVFRWGEEQAYPTKITAQCDNTLADFTVSGYLFGSAVTANLINRVLRVGTILERESDGVQVQVTSMAGVDDGSPFKATVAAYGNSSGADDSGAVDWRIISEPWTDFTDASASREIDRTLREVGTQIHAETFEIAQTRENTDYELVSNETEHQISALLRKLKRQEAYAALRSRPYYSSSYKFGNYTERPSQCGVFHWPVITQAESANTNVYVNLSSAEITKDDLNNLIRNMELTEHSNFNQGNWRIVCHPNVFKFIAEFDSTFRRSDMGTTKAGFTITDFMSDSGKNFPIVSDRYMRPDVVGVVDFSACSRGYYKNDNITRKELATQGRYRRWLVSYQTYGIVVRSPRQAIGMIYGAATS